MAIGWISVLKMVPWGDVISNAPKLAEAAKSLWNTVGKKPAVVNTPTPSARTAEPTSLATLQAQLDAVEAQTARLHEQMLSSSELIKALAEQNTQLIQRVEANRRRLWRVSVVAMLALILAITALVR